MWRTILLCIFAIASLAQESPVEEAVAPVYPAAALLARASGSVIVTVHVGEHAKVTDASVVEGNALLRPPSLDAARQWRFAPQQAGHDLKLIFSFRLMPQNTPEAQLSAVFRPPYAVEVRHIDPEPVSRVARNGLGDSPAKR